MNKILLIIVSIIMLLFGSLFFLYQESWIIISLPFQTSSLLLKKSLNISKEVTLWTWKQHCWNQEITEIIMSDNVVQNIQLLLNQWFVLLEEEQIIDKLIVVQSVALSASGQEAFISLSQNPFNIQQSTYQKCMMVEGLLKTLRMNTISVQFIRLLVHHQPISDDHLNFTVAWPILGYMNL